MTTSATMTLISAGAMLVLAAALSGTTLLLRGAQAQVGPPLSQPSATQHYLKTPHKRLFEASLMTPPETIKCGLKFGYSVSMDGDLAAVSDWEDCTCGETQHVSPQSYQVPPVCLGCGVTGGSGLPANPVTPANMFDADYDCQADGTAFVYERNPQSGLWDLAALLKNPLPPRNAGTFNKFQSADRFGLSVAVTHSASTGRKRVVVGGQGDSHNGYCCTGVDNFACFNADSSGAAPCPFSYALINWYGSAYAFDEMPNGQWMSTGWLKPAPYTHRGHRFGHSVDTDGDWVIASGFGENSCATGVDPNPSQFAQTCWLSGAAYIFEYLPGPARFVQRAYLKASNAEGTDSFSQLNPTSNSDTLSRKGVGITAAAGPGGPAAAIVGAAQEDSCFGAGQADNSCPDSGGAYMFERGTNGAWSQVAFLKVPNTGRHFGASVDIDGSIAVVGMSGDQSCGTGVNNYTTSGCLPALAEFGAAFVFERSPTGAWTQTAMLKPHIPHYPNSRFGYQVKVSGDRIVVSAPREKGCSDTVNDFAAPHSSVNCGSTGSAYTFERDCNGKWVAIGYHKAFNRDPSDEFGTDVDISGDFMIAGAPNEGSEAMGTNNLTLAADNSWQSGAAYIQNWTVPEANCTPPVTTGLTTSATTGEGPCFSFDNITINACAGPPCAALPLSGLTLDTCNAVPDCNGVVRFFEISLQPSTTSIVSYTITQYQGGCPPNNVGPIGTNNVKCTPRGSNGPCTGANVLRGFRRSQISCPDEVPCASTGGSTVSNPTTTSTGTGGVSTGGTTGLPCGVAGDPETTSFCTCPQSGCSSCAPALVGQCQAAAATGCGALVTPGPHFIIEYLSGSGSATIYRVRWFVDAQCSSLVGTTKSILCDACITRFANQTAGVVGTTPPHVQIACPADPTPCPTTGTPAPVTTGCVPNDFAPINHTGYCPCSGTSCSGTCFSIGYSAGQSPQCHPVVPTGTSCASYFPPAPYAGLTHLTGSGASSAYRVRWYSDPFCNVQIGVTKEVKCGTCISKYLDLATNQGVVITATKSLALQCPPEPVICTSAGSSGSTLVYSTAQVEDQLGSGKSSSEAAVSVAAASASLLVFAAVLTMIG